MRGAVIDTRSGVRYPCLIRDGSITGCKIACSFPDELSDNIHLAIPSLAQPIRGRIRWRGEKMAGVEFHWRTTSKERRRGAPRRKVVIDALILDRDHKRLTDCVIRDASRTGCRIATESAPRLPEEGDEGDEICTLDNHYLV